MENLLTDQEIHMLGLQALIPWLEGHGFVVDYVQPEECAVPHIFALSGEMLTVIVAAADMYPNKGKVTEADKAAALDIPCFACPPEKLPELLEAALKKHSLKGFEQK